MEKDRVLKEGENRVRRYEQQYRDGTQGTLLTIEERFNAKMKAAAITSWKQMGKVID